MPETPKEFNASQHQESTEQEAREQNVHELFERHTLLANELKELVGEEGILIAANRNDKASYKRLDEINRRERELIEKQGEIEKEMADLLSGSR